MVYTISLNTAIDEILIVKSNIKDNHNLIKEKCLSLGGKSIKTNILLSKNKIDNITLGIIGGENGKIYKEMLKENGIKSNLINSRTYNTRKTTVIVDDYEGGSTMLVEDSTSISKEDKLKFFKSLDIIEDNSIVLVAGSLPKGFSIDNYKDLLKILKEKFCDIICDVSGEQLKIAIDNEVSFIKPNEEEFCNLFHLKVNEIDEFDVHEKFKKIENYAVTLGGEGSIYKSNNKKGRIYISKKYSNDFKIRSTTGCGDMFVAGYILGIELGQNPIILGTKYSMAKSLSYFSDKYNEEVLKKIENYLEDKCYI